MAENIFLYKWLVMKNSVTLARKKNVPLWKQRNSNDCLPYEKIFGYLD